jgi:hypothetical protein
MCKTRSRLKKAGPMVVSKRKIVPPVCGKCGGPTRLVDIEPHVTLPRVDVLTFECEKCGTLEVIEAPFGQHRAPTLKPAN